MARTTRRLGPAALALAAVIAAAAPAWATPEPVDDWTTVTGSAIQFLGGDTFGIPAGWSAPSTTPLSPFGGDSQLPPDALAPVTISGFFDVVVSPTGGPLPRDVGLDGTVEFPGPPARLDPVPGQGFEIVTDFGFPDDAGFFPPTAPGLAPPGTLQDLVVAMGFAEDPDALVGSTPVSGGDGLVVIPTGYPMPTPLDGPVLIRGGRVSGPLPLDGCNGAVIELGVADLVTIPWSGPAPNDLFAGTSHATVTRCAGGGWQPAIQLVNTGSSFQQQDSAHTITILTESGWLHITPYDVVAGTAGSRLFAFTTPEANPYQPETVGFTAYPPFPALAPPEDRPWIVTNPYPTFFEPAPIGVWPTPIEFSSGTCPPDGFTSPFELYAFDAGSDGTAGGYLLQLDTNQATIGDIVVDGGSITGSLTGSGPGYTESYDLGSSTYSYLDGDECTWNVTIGEQPAIITDLTTFFTPIAPSSTTTSTVASTPSSTQPASTPSSQPSAAPPVTTDGGNPTWPWFVGLTGIGLLTFGGVVTVRSRRRPAAVPPGQLGAYYGGDDGGDLTMEDLEQYRDGSLSTYTEVRGGQPPPVVVGPDDEWDALILREHALQTRIEEAFEQVTTALTTGYSAYLEALDDFRTASAPVMAATVDMDRSLVVGTQDLATAKTADFLWAVLTLTKSVGTIGFKAYKWLKAPKAAATAPTGLAMAADELGVDLQQWLSRYDDAAEGASELLLAVAKERGWKMMPLWSEWTLKRILYNVRSAQAGRVAHIPYDDIAALQQWAQRPGFWDDLAKAANAVRYPDGTVEDIALAFTKADIDFLRKVAEADDLGRLLSGVDDALKAPGAFTGPVRMPLTYYLPDEDAFALLWRQRNANTLVPPYAAPPIDSTAGTFLDGANAVRGSGAASVPFRGIDPEAGTLIDGLPATGFHPGPPPGFNPHADTIIDTWRRGWGGVPPTNWDRAPTWIDRPITPAPWNEAPTVIDMPIPPTNWHTAPTLIDMPIPPTNWQRADTVVTMRFPGPLDDVSVDLFATQPTLLTHGAGSVDEAAGIAGALRTGPGGTVVLSGPGATDVAVRLDPAGRLTTTTLPDGSVAHGPGAIAAGADPGAVVAIHGPDAAAAAARPAGGVPFTDPARIGEADLRALDAIIAEGLLNRAATYVELTKGPFSIAAGPGGQLTVGSLLDPGLGVVGYPSPAGVDPHIVIPVDPPWPAPDQPISDLFGDAGLDPGLWMGSHDGDPFAGADRLFAELGQRRGWHPIQDADRAFLDGIIGAARRWAVGGDPVSGADLDRLSTWSARPGFFTWMASSVVPVEGGYALPYNLDDVDLLQNLLLSGGDRTALRNRLGPIRLRAYTAVVAGGADSSPTGAAPSHRRVDPQRAHFEQVVRSYLNATHTSQIGLDQFLRSFGVVNDIDNDFKFWFFGTRTVERGDTATFLNAWWSFFSSPIETSTSWYWTAEAHQQFMGLLTDQQANLSDMVTAARHAVRALQGIVDALGVLDDPNSGIGANTRNDLRGVLGDMEATFRGAPQPWQDAHREQLLEKQAHIRTKLSNLESAIGPLTGLKTLIPQLITWIDALRLDPNGEQRLGYQLISPEVAARLGSAALALQGLANPALLLDTATRETAQGKPPAQPQPALSWEEMQAQAGERFAEIDALGDQEFDPSELDDLDFDFGDSEGD